MSQPLSQKMQQKLGLEADEPELNGRKVEVGKGIQVKYNEASADTRSVLRDILAVVVILLGVICLVAGVTLAFGGPAGFMALGVCACVLGVLLALL